VPGTARPADTTEVAECVRVAADAGTSLALRASGTKDRLGRATSATDAVDLSALAGIVTYEPEELILIARPATPLTQVETLLAEHGQHLAFEPPHWGAAATLGGTLGVGASGPRRFVAGAARDFVLGVEFIDGRGRVIRTGGRVVKNVTGFDMWRSLVGAYGTLGIMTEVCLKLWPLPETQRTVAVGGLTRTETLARMFAWSRRPEAISGLSYTPEDGTLWARVEGSSVAAASQAEALWREAGAGDILDEAASRDYWDRLREAGALIAAAGEVLYRIAVPPSRANHIVTALEELGLCCCALDWGGGLLWAVLPKNCAAADIHAVVGDAAGMAARIGSGPEDPNDDAFTPLAEGVARLNTTLRRTLDPQGLFNPGRLSEVA
jgi:glycolate oxidase FAD binding subunit